MTSSSCTRSAGSLYVIPSPVPHGNGYWERKRKEKQTLTLTIHKRKLTVMCPPNVLEPVGINKTISRKRVKKSILYKSKDLLLLIIITMKFVLKTS